MTSISDGRITACHFLLKNGYSLKSEGENVSNSEDIVDSPCVRNCCLDAEDICLGCFRSLQEILDWHEASADDRRGILVEARHRTTKLGRPVET